MLEQEFAQRILHITDFFVEGREDELLEQEASYRRAIDHAPACIFMADAADGRIFDANQVAEQLLGFAARRARRATGARSASARPSACGRSACCARAQAQGHASRDDLHLLTRTRAASSRCSSTPASSSTATGAGIQLICVDISDRKRLESQLIQSEKMAAIGQLAAGIAHELRNPLAIVMNALYDLRQVLGAAPAEVLEDLHIAEEEISRAQAIIKNLLEFSRESGAELERVDVNDLLQPHGPADAEVPAEQRRAGDRPSSAPIPPCVANQNAMRQILLNLITNAVQAMPTGGELFLRTGRADGDRIRLEVQRHRRRHPRRPPAATSSTRSSPPRRPGRAPGLGLSVVHSVVQRYRGDIRVASEVGVGTTFTIELPCPCHDDAGGVGASA